MPLLMLCGHPASGKTTKAQQLLLHFKSLKRQAKLINEQSLGLDRNKAYQSSQSEKVTRSLLKAQVERHLSSQSIVILDSMNYIKGFRYQLYCVARQVKSTYCMYYLPVDLQQALFNNQSRKEPFSKELLEQLFKRMQSPSLRNRWDTPLFQRNFDQPIPFQEITQTLLFQTKKIKDPVATKQQVKTEGDHLYEIDTRLQSIIDQILQNQSKLGPHCTVVRGSVKIQIKQVVSALQLRKFKKDFMVLTRSKMLKIEQAQQGFLEKIDKSL